MSEDAALAKVAAHQSSTRRLVLCIPRGNPAGDVRPFQRARTASTESQVRVWGQIVEAVPEVAQLAHLPLPPDSNAAGSSASVSLFCERIRICKKLVLIDALGMRHIIRGDQYFNPSGTMVQRHLVNLRDGNDSDSAGHESEYSDTEVSRRKSQPLIQRSFVSYRDDACSGADVRSRPGHLQYGKVVAVFTRCADGRHHGSSNAHKASRAVASGLWSEHTAPAPAECIADADTVYVLVEVFAAVPALAADPPLSMPVIKATGHWKIVLASAICGRISVIPYFPQRSRDPDCGWLWINDLVRAADGESPADCT